VNRNKNFTAENAETAEEESERRKKEEDREK
jgi:hypothetical protein